MILTAKVIWPCTSAVTITITIIYVNYVSNYNVNTIAISMATCRDRVPTNTNGCILM